MTNSLASLEAAELTDREAGRLAHQIAAERFLPIQAKHYEGHLALMARSEKGIAYDRASLDLVWKDLLEEAMREVEVLRDLDLLRRLQKRARVGLAARLGLQNETS